MEGFLQSPIHWHLFARNKRELLNTWAIDRTRFNPDATEPPLCLRCGRPLHPVLSRNGHSRYIDVRICDDCDMDETWGAAMGRTKYFINWDAVTEHRLKVPADDNAWIIKSICPFDQIYLETSKDELGHKSPRTEVAYSRSDYDGQRWCALQTSVVPMESSQFRSMF